MYQGEPTTLFSSACPPLERAPVAQLGEGCPTLDWKTKRGELTGTYRKLTVTMLLRVMDGATERRQGAERHV